MAARVRSQAGRLARRSLDVFDVCGGVLCVSSWPCKLFSLCGERGSLYGRVSGLLVAVVPLGGQGRRGTWASVAAGCGLNTRSGQDLEHRLHHRGVWVACGLFPDRGRNPRLCMGTGSLTTGPPGKPQSRTRDGSLDVTAFSWRGSKRSGQGEGHNLDVLSMGSLSPGGAVQTPIREEGDDFAFL